MKFPGLGQHCSIRSAMLHYLTVKDGDQTITTIQKENTGFIPLQHNFYCSAYTN